MKPGYIVMLVFGTIFALLGFSLAVVGAAAASAGSVQDGNGYLNTPAEQFSVTSYALTSPRMESAGERGLPAGIGSIRLRATSTTDADIFIGVAPQAVVDRYLAGVNHSELTNVNFTPFRAEYLDIPGTSTPAAPGDQAWWTVSAEGPGTQEITWDITAGRWAVVVMNADARPGVSASLQAGVHLGFLGPLAIGLLVLGAMLLVIGVLLTVFGAIGLGRNGTPPPGTGATGAAGAAASAAGLPPGPAEADETRRYPARLTGHLDIGLSRWLWLVKWILVFPHLVVLFFLWFAFFVTTVFAGFAILFTGRYPAAVFRFNVGVLRWSWRVAFYSYSALGTDRYPPFSLASSAEYPADLEVDYPERLSNGLVLVKWWLLAIPQLLIVAAFSGSAWTWRPEPDNGTTTTGPSLLGLLVLVAAVILLFTGRYRRTLFDFILGIDRWIFRVIVYTALLRDEYPPFRLDQGPADPPPGAAPAVASPLAATTP
jgi:hypothetical protein